MKRACIAIVDAARARIYTYDQTAEGERAAPVLDQFAACALFVSDDGQVQTTSSWLDILDRAA